MALGINHNATGQYRKAISYHIAGVKTAEQLNDREKELRGKIDLGITLGNVEELEKARRVLQEALRIAHENTVEEGEAHHAIANIQRTNFTRSSVWDLFTEKLEKTKKASSFVNKL